jgi:hypothetical protein
MALWAFGCNGLGSDLARAIGLSWCFLGMLAPRPVPRM